MCEGGVPIGGGRADKARLRAHGLLCAALLLILAANVLIHDLSGVTIFEHTPLDSYTLQAMAWREGRLSLKHDYDYLELAKYNDEVYVSFPPVPTLPMLALSFIFDYLTPNTLAVLLYAMLAFAAVYFALYRCGAPPASALGWGVLFVFGSNLANISVSGGVWYQAQALSFLLSALAAWLVFSPSRASRALAFACLALAVGCRPFQIVYFPLLIWVSADVDRGGAGGTPLKAALLKQLPLLAPPLLIGAALAAYNAARFGNPLEFGHNYLPEFLEAPGGQFSLSYLKEHVVNLFARFPAFDRYLFISLPKFDGFAFYLANPIFVMLAVWGVRDAVRLALTPAKIMLLASMALHLFLLMLHKSFGGWQFGARYTIDLIPFILVYIALDKRTRMKGWETAVAAFAVIFNTYGTLAQFIKL